MGFLRIALGFVFMFDYRINRFDVLPDFIGYILIFWGLTMLSNLNSRFDTAKKFAIPLIILSLLDVYEIDTPSSLLSTFLLVLGIATIALNLLTVYNLCMGIAEKADELGKRDLRELAKKRWSIYMAYGLVLMFSFAFLVVLPFVAFGLFIFTIVIIIIMAALMYAANKEIKT